jgi:hypothetical protein
MRTRRAFLVLACSTAIAPPPFWKRGDWITLGTRRVSLFMDRDQLRVVLNKGLAGLKSRVCGIGMIMERLKVRFANDDSADLPVRNSTKAGSETGTIPMSFPFRATRLIERESQKLPIGSASWVTVLGRQT